MHGGGRSLLRVAHSAGLQQASTRPLSAYAGKASEPSDWFFPISTTFGAGRASEISSILAAKGASRPLVVTDRGLGSSDLIEAQVEGIVSAGLAPLLFADVDANPTDVNIYAGAEAFRSHRADSVVAIGGGSGLDAGKAIAMVARSGFSLAEFEWTKEPVTVPVSLLPSSTVSFVFFLLANSFFQLPFFELPSFIHHCKTTVPFLRKTTSPPHMYHHHHYHWQRLERSLP